MATVTGYTAAKTEELMNEQIIDGNVVGDNLMLVTRGGPTINAGNVRGPQGLQGPPGENFSIFDAGDPLSGEAGALINAAANLAEAAGGGIVYTRPGVWSFTNTATMPTWRNNVIYMIPAGCEWVQNAWQQNRGLLRGGGSIVNTQRSLLVAATEGSSTVTVSVADAGGITAGATYLLGSEDNFTTGVSAVDKGELVVVQSVNTITGVVTLSRGLRDSYTVSPGVAKLVGPITFVKNCGVIGKGKVRNSDVGGSSFSMLLEGTFLKNVIIQDVELYGSNRSGVHFNHCVRVWVDKIFCDEFGYNTSLNHYGYGVAVGGASENWFITNSIFRRVRHGVTSMGDAAPPSISPYAKGIPRDVIVANCQAIECKSSPFDTHEAGEDWLFIGCIARDMLHLMNEGQAGFNIRSRNTKIHNCEVENAMRAGIQFAKGSDGSESVGCSIRRVKNDPFISIGIGIGIAALDIKIISPDIDTTDDEGIAWNGGSGIGSRTYIRDPHIKNPGADGDPSVAIMCSQNNILGVTILNPFVEVSTPTDPDWPAGNCTNAVHFLNSGSTNLAVIGVRARGITGVPFTTPAATMNDVTNYFANNVKIDDRTSLFQMDPVYTTAGRPLASAVGNGARIYDDTLNKPIWSDGAVWRDAAGVAV